MALAPVFSLKGQDRPDMPSSRFQSGEVANIPTLKVIKSL
jgi:hypothetical protein